MLEIYNILWVIPGVIFISIYNRRRPGQAINLSGWSYVFSLVIISIVTWFPAEFIAQFFSTHLTILNDKQNQLLNMLSVLGIAVVFTFFWLLLFQWGMIAKLILPSVYDDFYTKCLEWKEKAILLTLKNGKVYIGILSNYTKNPIDKHESQTISIIPLKSGYRENKQKRVVWTTNYPYAKSFFTNMEVIIPRSEIITFGKFNVETHRYFESLKTQSKD